jgi:hypothetical protein
VLDRERLTLGSPTIDRGRERLSRRDGGLARRPSRDPAPPGHLGSDRDRSAPRGPTGGRRPPADLPWLAWLAYLARATHRVSCQAWAPTRSGPVRCRSRLLPAIGRPDRIGSGRARSGAEPPPTTDPVRCRSRLPPAIGRADRAGSARVGGRSRLLQKTRSSPRDLPDDPPCVACGACGARATHRGLVRRMGAGDEFGGFGPHAGVLVQALMLAFPPADRRHLCGWPPMRLMYPMYRSCNTPGKSPKHGRRRRDRGPSGHAMAAPGEHR